MGKKIVVVGSGGREHALGWMLSQSSDISQVIYTPGNGGTEEGKGKNVNIDVTNEKNFPAFLDFLNLERVDGVVVGPEGPLDKGFADYLNSRGYNRVFAPTKTATLLESDKFFSYDLMRELGIPQANSIKCSSTEEAVRAIEEIATGNGVAIKARGLTGGKGVTVCHSKEQALKEIREHASKYGPEVLIAERLFGQEFSIFGISDGNRVLPLEISVQDHKPLLDGDNGPNTGGMGAYCPTGLASAKEVRDLSDRIFTPIVQRMRERGTPFAGFIYGGMISNFHGAKVLEFNARMGDPETQAVMMTINRGFNEAILDILFDGKLSDSAKVEFKPGAACNVVLATPGYPEKYAKGLPITGIAEANKLPGVKVFHAGTTKLENGTLVNSGGRVLGVCAYSEGEYAAADKVLAAQRQAYAAVDLINAQGGFACRRDIGDKSRWGTK